MINRLSRAKIKFFKALGQKNEREREGLFVAEGRKMVAEGLRESWRCVAIIGQEKELGSLENLSFDSGTEYFSASQAEIGEISSLKNPEPLLGIFEIRKDVFDLNGENGLILDGISDPGNLGTLLRTADWFGITQILAGPGTADRFNPKVLRSTMGSVFRVKFATSLNLVRELADSGEKIWAADMEGEAPDLLKSAPRPFLLMGNESRGISQEILAIQGIRKVLIPGKGDAESLNVAVAGGILMYLKG